MSDFWENGGIIGRLTQQDCMLVECGCSTLMKKNYSY
jgi:hypothetical protein